MNLKEYEIAFNYKRKAYSARVSENLDASGDHVFGNKWTWRVNVQLGELDEVHIFYRTADPSDPVFFYEVNNVDKDGRSRKIADILGGRKGRAKSRPPRTGAPKSRKVNAIKKLRA